jgi:hypothetical protein
MRQRSGRASFKSRPVVPRPRSKALMRDAGSVKRHQHVKSPHSISPLCTRCERPRAHHTEQRDELAVSMDRIYSVPSASQGGPRIAGYRICENPAAPCSNAARHTSLPQWVKSTHYRSATVMPGSPQSADIRSVYEMPRPSLAACFAGGLSTVVVRGRWGRLWTLISSTSGNSPGSCR